MNKLKHLIIFLSLVVSGCSSIKIHDSRNCQYLKLTNRWKCKTIISHQQYFLSWDEMMVMIREGAVLIPVQDYAEQIKMAEKLCNNSKKQCYSYQNGDAKKALDSLKSVGRLEDVSDQIEF